MSVVGPRAWLDFPLKPFQFDGELAPSKSQLLRHFLLATWNPELLGSLRGRSSAEDVRAAEGATEAWNQGHRTFTVGASATWLRLLALRLTRVPGTYTLLGSPRLFERPQGSLRGVLRALGTEVAPAPGRWEVRVEKVIPLAKAFALVSASLEETSQVASALVLNAWNDVHGAELRVPAAAVSLTYLEMSLGVVTAFGGEVTRDGDLIRVRAVQPPIPPHSLGLEADASTAFTVAVLGLLGGKACIRNFPDENSRQADLRFLDLFTQMGIQFTRSGRTFEILRQDVATLRPLSANIAHCPDLFPVLAALLAFVPGRSELRGAAHLEGKESPRITKTAELLRALGRKVEVFSDGLAITGDSSLPPSPFTFDPEDDHRMAFAAAVLGAQGGRLRLLTPEVVTKSFPELWSHFS